MKIQANQVEVGMTITTGVITMIVDNIKTSYQKNGKELKVFSGNVIRTMGRGIKPRKYYRNDLKIKSTTLLVAK